MCTLSFIPRENGYLLAMNRDERLTREPALLPALFEINGTRAVFPHESSGGTWIGVNDRGLALALLNQNLNSHAAEKKKSRGMVVRELLSGSSARDVRSSIERLDLSGTLPFRLFAFVRGEQAILEWSWDGSKLQTRTFPWEHGHWFSSGVGDATATHERGAVCRAAWRQRRSGTLMWLRQLHRSHRPKRGAFSICVHRDDAETVSYTEISCAKGSLELRYHPGSPCIDAEAYTAKLDLRPADLAVNFSRQA